MEERDGAGGHHHDHGHDHGHGHDSATQVKVVLHHVVFKILFLEYVQKYFINSFILKIYFNSIWYYCVFCVI